MENPVKKKKTKYIKRIIEIGKGSGNFALNYKSSRIYRNKNNNFKIEKKFSLQLFPLRELLRIANLRAVFC